MTTDVPDATIVVIDQNNEQVMLESSALEIVELSRQGLPGPTGPPGTGAFAYDFSWGDATPALIITAPALATIIKTEVVLLTPFNAAALLSVGDSADHESLFAANSIDLSLAGTWQSNISKVCAGSTAINLYLTLIGNVSAGSGLIFIYF